MSTIYKKIGEISLRDFKNLFDRPGFYRFHFKTVDQEFGMVKEEVLTFISHLDSNKPSTSLNRAKQLNGSQTSIKIIVA